MARRIGFVAFPSANAVDLAGPAEVFTAANLLSDGAPPYEIVLLSTEGAPVRSRAGLTFLPDARLEDAPPLDTLIVPGGAALRTDPEALARIAAWIAGRAADTRRLVSVCTGFYALAASGVLDGRRAAIHWRYRDAAARQFPRVSLDPEAIFVRDGPCATSAGVAAGIDLALALVEEDLGAAMALATARELVVYFKRSGAQLQYSEPLRFQMRGRGRLSDLPEWLLSNLAADLSIDALAAQTNLSPRHFVRLFKASFGTSPANLVEHLRIDEAARRLLHSKLGLEEIARSVGYAHADTFRRAFERRFDMAPSAYRDAAEGQRRVSAEPASPEPRAMA
jgi:transcriptional regulator GlxA family with amidase domain